MSSISDLCGLTEPDRRFDTDSICFELQGDRTRIVPCQWGALLPVLAAIGLTTRWNPAEVHEQVAENFEQFTDIFKSKVWTSMVKNVAQMYVLGYSEGDEHGWCEGGWHLAAITLDWKLWAHIARGGMLLRFTAENEDGLDGDFHIWVSLHNA